MDISYILESWPYDPEDNVRIIKTTDNRDVVQVRLPYGIEQYELTNRPDGLKPDGFLSYLDKVKAALSEYVKINGSLDGFFLSADDFRALEEEATLYYYRYVHLFKLGEFEFVVADTGHNIDILEMVRSYYSGDDKINMLQYSPYIIRMHSVASAMLLLREQDIVSAERVLKDALDMIYSTPDEDSPIYFFEKLRSVSYINSFVSQLKDMEPDPLEELKRQLKLAIEKENYEKAAEIRDRLRRLSSDSSH
ncbi:UvrB/UvrC motif-containing protein [Spirochaetia bacterium 38H-sp]|uniref:UvrB/UvrC motif-containing protein n=1 Tax=Rarispira pelagica TaxID=3141764 RepID=A0ABU9U9Y4_9SPIR